MRVRELAVRVDALEKQVSLLLQLPAQVADLTERVAGVESQVLQLRHEMRDGFSAIRSDLGSRIEAVAPVCGANWPRQPSCGTRWPQ